MGCICRRAIDKALPGGLRFDILITTRELQANGILLSDGNDNAAVEGVADSQDAAGHTNLAQASLNKPRSIDCNALMWSCLFAQIAALHSPRQSSTKSQTQTQEQRPGRGQGQDDMDMDELVCGRLRTHLRALERDDIACVDDLDWFQFPDTFRAASVVSFIWGLYTTFMLCGVVVICCSWRPC